MTLALNIKKSLKRTATSLKADIIFLAKQGLLIVFVVVAALYIIILSQLPNRLLAYAVPIVIFTDPSVLGLIFSGAILMLEKEQGITNYLAVTPLRFYEYIASKVSSLALISMIISLAISITSYPQSANYLIIIIAVVLVSVFFTLLGFIVSESCTSMNQFIMKAGGLMGIFMLPCFSIIGFKFSELFYLVPSVSALKLLFGAYIGIKPLFALAIVIYLVIWDVILIIIAKKAHEKRFT